MMDKKLIQLEAKKELARREFFYFCNLLAPNFYKEDRAYLVETCNKLQDFYYSDDEVLIINMPPRHGKSRSAGLFVEWILGKNKNEKIMTGSYNETLSTMFSKNVRNAIQEEKADIDTIIYNDIFPNTKIKHGDGAMNLWSLEGGYNNYLATSPSGTATGFGCSLMIVDDLIKNAEEAYNENVLEKHWDWFTNTMLSRLEEGGKIIIIMTRWSSKDLAGRALEHYKEEGKKVRHINMKALQEDGNMLCEEVLSLNSYKSKVRAMGEDIASANYQQEPIDLKGCLYTKFKTYDKLPVDNKGNLLFTSIKAYVDTADEGADYLCSIVYGVYNKEAYVLDVLYTKESMETTEYKTARMFYENEVNKADIESNNGGRAFARSVQRLLKEKFNSNKTTIKWFHQSKNKNARILSNSSWVMEHIYFPPNWRDKWTEFYKAMTSYQREGKNKHDDACFEEGTQISTLFGNKSIEKIKEGEYVFTPFGLRKVLWSGCTGEKETINKLGLKATRNHKVFSYINGFISLDKLTGISETSIISLKELMLWKYKKLLYSMEKNIDLWDKRSIILVSQVKMKKENMLKDFMWQFGSLIIKGKFQKAIIFIIKILILLITTLITWNVFRINNTYRYMQRKILKMKNFTKQLLTTLIRQEKKLPNGIKVKKVENGTQNMQNRFQKILKYINVSVKNVGTILKAKYKHLNFVQTNVEKDGEVKTDESNIYQNVLYVEQNLLAQNTRHLPKKDKHVQSHAQTDSTTLIESKKVKVYNLTVEGNHVYYAHGFLVSNCDAITGVAEKALKGQGLSVFK